MSMIFQMTVKLLAYSADMFQPFIEADFVFCLLRNGNDDSPNGSRRHDAANRHHFSVSAVHHVIYHASQRGLGHSGRSVGQANDDFATIILVHGVEDAASDVRAHAVQGRHRHVGSGCNHLCLLEQTTSFHVTVIGCLLTVVISDTQSHEAIGYERVADEDGELRHHIHVIFLAIRNQAFTVIRTPVVFERRITQGQLLRPFVRSKTANQATEEDEHHGAAKHFVVHEFHAWSSSDGYDGEGSSSVSIRQTEHQPHTVPALSHRPSHDSRGNQLGEHARHNHDCDQPKRFGMAEEDAYVDNHAHSNQEIWNEERIAHKLEARHQGTCLGNETVDYQACKERSKQSFETHHLGQRSADEDESQDEDELHDTILVATQEPASHPWKHQNGKGDI